MIHTNMLIGVPIVTIILNAAIGAVIPPPMFLKVHEMRVAGDQVIVERSIPKPAGVADWSVVVVAADQSAPSCQTIPGDAIHEGWSVYTPSPKTVNAMHMDVWVGYAGCYDKLLSGKHDMYVTWTPRNGMKPVTAHTTFTK